MTGNRNANKNEEINEGEMQLERKSPMIIIYIETIDRNT